MISAIKTLLSLCVVLALATPSFAVFNLQVTEIWPGNEPGSELSEDWFEITNFGDTTWTAAIDGDLYFDDASIDPTAADLISEVDAIGPGESAIFVDGGQQGALDWFLLWDDVLSDPNALLLGSYDGAGLGGGGDTVAIFLDSNFDGPQIGELLATGSYPEADSNGGQSYDTRLGQFSVVGNRNGAFATTVLNDIGQAAIGSPGMAPVPEPSALGLCGLGLLMAACVRRRRHRLQSARVG